MEELDNFRIVRQVGRVILSVNPLRVRFSHGDFQKEIPMKVYQVVYYGANYGLYYGTKDSVISYLLRNGKDPNHIYLVDTGIEIVHT